MDGGLGRRAAAAPGPTEPLDQYDRIRQNRPNTLMHAEANGSMTRTTTPTCFGAAAKPLTRRRRYRSA